MKKRFKVNKSPEPYKIEWISKDKDLSDFNLIIDSVNFYDEGFDEEFYLSITKQNLVFEIEKADEENLFDIFFEGQIEIETSEIIMDLLDESEYIDYVIYFVDENGKEAKEGREFWLRFNNDLWLKSVEED